MDQEKENNHPTQIREMPRAIEHEMKKSYIDYAMSVIVGRALPDARDGLKPVHRRILYAMYDMGLASNKPYKKSARVVGECFIAGTRVLTDKGLIRIEEIERGDTVFTQNGKSMVSELYEMPERSLLRISFETGVSVTVTPSQLLKVINKDLKYEWKSAEQLTSDDHLVMRLTYPDDLPYVILPDFRGREMKLDENIAYLIGQFLSDGHIEETNGNSNCVRFNFNSSSMEIMERIKSALNSAFSYDAKIKSSNYSYQQNGRTIAGTMNLVRINSTEINRYLSSALGIDASWKASTKRIPEQFFKSPKSVIAALLSGLIDGDGSVHAKRSIIHYGTVSDRMAQELQIIMQHLGVMSRHYIDDHLKKEPRLVADHYAACNHDFHSIEIAGRFAKVLGRAITLSNEKKQERIELLLKRNNDAASMDRVPYSGRVFFKELSEHHIGSGWYVDIQGHKFRDGISYSDGTKIRYSSDLRDKPLGRTQIVDWGIQSKLERIGSNLAVFSKEILDNDIYFARVKSVEQAPAQKTYDIQVEGQHEFVANGILAHNCLGKYHPHGDTAVYDSLVRMAQTFSLRCPLVDGQGNFGSVDGDEAAAMRYTECRLDPNAELMLDDIDKETVKWLDNFDGSLKEPAVLPSKLPNLLVNGSSGIAVGMATNIPPHNLREVVDALVYLVDNPNAESLDLMQFVKGPDFPTGGIIYGLNGIVEAYSTGKGLLRVRAKTRLEENGEGKKRIIVDEIPYQVNKSTLMENIAELVKDKRIDGITDLRDESDRDGMRIVIELRKDAMDEIVLNQLFSHTQMEVTFGVINIALVNNEPRVLTLKEMLCYYLGHRKEVVTKRTQFELKEAMARDHILQGLMKAVDELDETLRIIRSAKSGEEAREGLISRFELDDTQAKAILDMRLQKLTGLEINGLRTEFLELEKRIRELEDILANEVKILEIIKGELFQIREEHGDERKTEIVQDEGELDIEDLIPNEEMVVMTSADGYIKRLPLDTYKQQHRGGIGLMGMETKEEDTVTDLFVSMTHNYIMFFTNQGRVYWLKAYRIPVGGRHSKGKPIINLLPKLENGEIINDMIPISQFDEKHNLVFATKKGIIKKTPLDSYSNVRSCGIIAVGLEEGDELVDTKLTDGEQEIILATKNGQAVRFQESDVRTMGRPARGVIGVRLDEGDQVVSMAVARPDAKLLTVSENGFGKISLVEDYRKTHRGGKGVITIKTGDRNGAVVSVRVVSDEDELLITSLEGMVIRIPVADIRTMGRATMGVTIMRLREGDRVTAVARLAGEKEKMLIAQTEAKEDLSILPEEAKKSDA